MRFIRLFVMFFLVVLTSCSSTDNRVQSQTLPETLSSVVVSADANGIWSTVVYNTTVDVASYRLHRGRLSELENNIPYMVVGSQTCFAYNNGIGSNHPNSAKIECIWFINNDFKFVRAKDNPVHFVQNEQINNLIVDFIDAETFYYNYSPCVEGQTELGCNRQRNLYISIKINFRIESSELYYTCEWKRENYYDFVAKWNAFTTAVTQLNENSRINNVTISGDGNIRCDKLLDMLSNS